jgi:CrcB protein
LPHHDDRFPVDADLAPGDPAGPSVSHHPGERTHRARELDVLGAIAVGGLLGALARYELSLAWPSRPGHFPWATFAINTSGAFLLGLLLGMLVERAGSTRLWRPFLCVGVLGAWTTMSTFAVDADLLVKDGSPLTALAYVCATVVIGVTMTAAGVGLARYFDPQRALWPSP